MKLPAIKQPCRSSSRQRRLNRVLGITFTIAIVIFLLANTDVSDMWKLVAGVVPGWLFVACLFFLLNKVCRAAQFLILTGLPPGHWLWMAAVSCAQSLAIQIFPARTGEVSYIYLAGKSHNVGVGSSITSLLAVRLLDVLTIAALFLITSGLSLGSLSSEARVYISIAIGMMVALTITILVIVIFRESICAFGVRFLERHLPHWFPPSWRSKLTKLIVEIDQSLSAIQSGKRISALITLSLIFWILIFSLNHILLLALNLDITLQQTVIGSTFGAFTSVIPISAVGNLGTLEAGWTAGLVLAGVDIQTAVFSGFAVHLLSFVYTIVFGLAGLVFVTCAKPKNNQNKKEESHG